MQKRFDAVCKISDRTTIPAEAQGAKVLDYFAEDVFDIAKWRSICQNPPTRS
ncbi:MAG: hypothetical protein IKX48_13850 [Victivallales bacterium]|nr:hypothetical protein [Victivallales bacterium]